MSNLFSLNWNDAKKALVLAVLTPVVAYVYQVLAGGGFNIDWGKVGSLAASALVAYLLKNYFSTSDGAVLGVIAKPE